MIDFIILILYNFYIYYILLLTTHNDEMGPIMIIYIILLHLTIRPSMQINLSVHYVMNYVILNNCDNFNM